MGIIPSLRLFFSRSLRTCRKRPARRMWLEQLEHRIQPSTDIASIDGSGNNLAHPSWGQAGSDLIRVAPAAYGDGVSTPAGSDRPGARDLSNQLFAQNEELPTNDRQMSAFVYAFGQFLDHDLDLTTAGADKTALNIPVPTGDPQFDPTSTGTQVIPMTRSSFDAATGTDAGNPRQQVTSVTSFIDGSMVYGSDPSTAAALRTFTGGHLKTGDGNLLPTDADGNVMAGDIRAAENPELTSLQVLFLREHNRIADQLAQANPGLSDEQLYQQARRWVIAEIQSITFHEFLPSFLGSYAPGRYQGYDRNVNPSIATEFSTAAYRFGHSLIGDDIEFLDNNGNEVRGELPMSEAFFNPGVLKETGIDPVLKYLASDRTQENDLPMVDALRNLLFGAPGSGGLDLAALDIQRGRDHGLSDYNATRVAYGLPAVTSFADITSDPALQAKLQELYGDVNHIDLFVGGLAEDHLQGASMGPTFARIIREQFERTRAGDRFWFENVFSGKQLDQLEHTTLADVIRANTSLTNLQANVFFFRNSISGQVFADPNANGQREFVEKGLPGLDVQLLDGDGKVVATTQTGHDGGYRFENLDLGSYQVQLVPPAGATITTPAPGSIKLTRGQDIGGGNFGVAPPTPPKPPVPQPPAPPKMPPPMSPPSATQPPTVDAGSVSHHTPARRPTKVRPHKPAHKKPAAAIHKAHPPAPRSHK